MKRVTEAFDQSLNERLAAIGVRLTTSGSSRSRSRRRSRALVDIEATLMEAAAQVPNDSKLFSLLLSWIEVHGDYVIVEKLMKRVRALPKPDSARVWINALAIFAAHEGFHKWKRWVEKSKAEVCLFDEELTRSSVQRKGAVSYFAKYGYLVPEGSVRVRVEDALTPKELAQINSQYRNRLLFGAAWRADIITAIQGGLSSPYEISKVLGCSYEPAHRIFNEYKLAAG